MATKSLLDLHPYIQEKISPEPFSGCWLWTAYVDTKGYPRYCPSGENKGSNFAYSIIYIFFNGPVPEGRELDHLCRVRSCVNPDHLEPVTHAENMFRSRKTHCKRGHILSAPNLKFTAKGHRQCKACGPFFGRQRRAREKALKATPR